MAAPRDQQLDVVVQSATEIGCRSWSDPDETPALSGAEGTACRRTDKIIRKRPRRPPLRP